MNNSIDDKSTSSEDDNYGAGPNLHSNNDVNPDPNRDSDRNGENEEEGGAGIGEERGGAGSEEEELNTQEEIFTFDTNCDQCSKPSTTRMKVQQIPHFKEVVIMATECEYCGHRTNEVKGCGGIEPEGKKYDLKVESARDLTRDVLKSESCSLCIPELELEIGSGVFVGKFTTVEGIFNDIKDDLKNPFFLGDNPDPDKREIIDRLIQSIDQVTRNERCVHLVLDDPTGSSYVETLDPPGLRWEGEASGGAGGVDAHLRVETYERTKEQNDDLGLSDMVLDNYG